LALFNLDKGKYADENKVLINKAYECIDVAFKYLGWIFLMAALVNGYKKSHNWLLLVFIGIYVVVFFIGNSIAIMKIGLVPLEAFWKALIAFAVDTAPILSLQG